ncbi:Nischarin [Frankliniella fusca]|uniref:Nischarin n=1 Tax=Frankliniella fusca TaxID=407009 RepID=A0AAE1H1W4_9NEOP|nr:Nischarin [Frankliniella fusca]
MLNTFVCYRCRAPRQLTLGQAIPWHLLINTTSLNVIIFPMPSYALKTLTITCVNLPMMSAQHTYSKN